MNYRIYPLLVVALLLCQSLLAGTTPALAAPYHQDPVALDTPFEIVIGDEVQVGESPDALFVFFAAVLKDTRCSAEENCSKEGEANFQFFVSPEERSDSEIITIGTASDARIAPYQGYVIELIEVNTPAPKPDENFILLDYRLTVVVRAAESQDTPAPEQTEGTPDPNTPTANDEGTPAPESQTNSGPEPIIVDRCINFTPFDAAAILQEPVNSDAPVGNIIFGPLLADFAGEEGGVQGFCGYASTLPSEGEIDRRQTHIVTNLGVNHAVVAKHLTADPIQSSSGTVLNDWLELFVLAEVVGAANPDHDSDKNFQMLYNYAGYLPLLEILHEDASAAASFQVVEVPLAKDDPHDAMLWLWQTLDDGYFSLLIGRKDLDFDIVAARLGPQVQEKTVLGYSRVILDQIAGVNPVSNTNSNTSNPTDDGMAGCNYLTPDEVEAIVDEPVQGQAVTNEHGDGCKYTPVEDDLTIDPSDFSDAFQTQGMLAGVVPTKAAHQLLSNMIMALATTGQVTDGDAFAALVATVETGDMASTLTQMAALQWDSNRWQVEALTDVSDDTLLIDGKSGNGWTQFFLMRPRADGGLYYLTGVLRPEIDEVREAIIAAAIALAEERVVTPVAGEPTTSDPAPPANDTTLGAAGDCRWLTLDEAASILGEAVQVKAVAGERGEGCKFFPASEDVLVEPDNFSLTFENQGLLVGVVPTEGAQGMLTELVDIMVTEGAAIEAETLTTLRTAVEDGDIQSALHQIATLQGRAGEWQIEALSTVSDDAIGMFSEMDGFQLAFFLRAKGDGSLFMIAVQLLSDSDVEAMQTAAIEALTKLGE